MTNLIQRRGIERLGLLALQSSIVVAVCLLPLACTQRETTVQPHKDATAGPDIVPAKDGTVVDPICKTVAPAKDNKVDVLFVVDNSSGLAEEQYALAQTFPKFMSAIRTSKLGGKLPDLRIGIVTTDLGTGDYKVLGCMTVGGDNGELQTKPRTAGCIPPKDPWIETKGGKTNVPSGSTDPMTRLIDAFTCIGLLGDEGCGFEQPLQSARLALDPLFNANPGFLRKDALLAVMILSEEDDCSAANPKLFDPARQGLNDPLGPLNSFRCFEFGVTCRCPKSVTCDRFTTGPRLDCAPGGTYLHKVADYISFFRALKKTPSGKPHPQRVIMAAIAGPTEKVEVGQDGSNPALKSSCQGQPGSAHPGIRIKALVHAFARKLTSQEINDIKNKRRTVPHWIDDKGTYRTENTSSICTHDYSSALERFGTDIVKAIGTRCVKP